MLRIIQLSTAIRLVIGAVYAVVAVVVRASGSALGEHMLQIEGVMAVVVLLYNHPPISNMLESNETSFKNCRNSSVKRILRNSKPH
jgi:hypothetical protein